MIYIGYTDAEKRTAISDYQATNDIRKVIVISADDFALPIEDTDQICYSDVIMYVTFYRLLQEIDSHTLIVLNECLRTQNRHDLAYNCIRNYLNQTTHQLIFNQLPQIDERDDFMILFDFDTRSQWKRRPFDAQLIGDNAQVHVRPLHIRFNKIAVPTSAATNAQYERTRDRLFSGLGNKDPHTLPRNLYMIAGKDKQSYIKQRGQQLSFFDTEAQRTYVARNKRIDGIVTYADVILGERYTIVDFPHRFIDFSDFVRRCGQSKFDVLTTDLKVDQWYFNRYVEWASRIDETYSSLQQ